LNRASELQQEMNDGADLPFSEFIACNIGNPQALKQKPITFLRQILSGVLNPGVLDSSILPSDVLERVEGYNGSVPSIGAYSDSQGILKVREEVADFIARRDGIESDPSNIYLTNGASEGVKF